MRYYATFIPGLQDFIFDVVKQRLKDVKIEKLLDGAVLFETETTYDKLNFFCFNNIFAVISVLNQNEEKFALEKHIRMGLEDSSDIITNNSKSFNTFRIVASLENIPASIDEKLKFEIEKHIARLSGLKVNRSLPDTEFWFLLRKEKSESFSVFMKRLTLRQSWEKTLHKGELPPPLAWALCKLAGLVHSDTVLDPFCGYGSIPQAALKCFHIKKFLACDNNKEAAKFTMSRFGKTPKEKFAFFNKDFEKLSLVDIEEKSIDVIITDPPWGDYKGVESDFYLKMFEVFGKLLKDDGRVVVLLGSRDEGVGSREEFGNFKLEKSIPILLSGKKAVINYLIKRI